MAHREGARPQCGSGAPFLLPLREPVAQEAHVACLVHAGDRIEPVIAMRPERMTGSANGLQQGIRPSGDFPIPAALDRGPGLGIMRRVIRRDDDHAAPEASFPRFPDRCIGALPARSSDRACDAAMRQGAAPHGDAAFAARAHGFVPLRGYSQCAGCQTQRPCPGAQTQRPSTQTR